MDLEHALYDETASAVKMRVFAFIRISVCFMNGSTSIYI